MRGGTAGPPGSALQHSAFWRCRGWTDALQKPRHQNAEGAWLGWGLALPSRWDNPIGPLANVTAGHHLVFKRTHFRKQTIAVFHMLQCVYLLASDHPLPDGFLKIWLSKDGDTNLSRMLKSSSLNRSWHPWSFKSRLLSAYIIFKLWPVLTQGPFV